MFTKKLVVAVIYAVALTAAAESASAELVPNGGFETGDFTNWRALGIVGAAPTITSTAANVYTGNFAAVLTKTDINDFILVDNDQFWTPVSGGQNLQVSYAAKKLAGGSDANLEVAIRTYTSSQGNPTGQFEIVPAWTPTTPGSSYTVSSFNYTVPADATRLYIAFRLPGGGPVGTYAIDAISANVVPEPTTLTFLATGLLGLFCCACRKRR